MLKKISLSTLLLLLISISSYSQKTIPTPLIDNQGFSITSLWRGVLGMVSLLVVAYLFSSNRKAINWKTVGAGLTAQLIIAFGVIKFLLFKKGLNLLVAYLPIF